MTHNNKLLEGRIERLKKFQKELKGICYFAYFDFCRDSEYSEKCMNYQYKVCDKYEKNMDFGYVKEILGGEE